VPEPEQVEVRLVEGGAQTDEVIVKPRGQA